MERLQELLATDHRQALEFFVVGFVDVCEPTVDRQELLYNASVLAHYAQVSTQTTVDVPTPKTLGEVFDHFVMDETLRRDSVMMETAGTQCLLLAGFFEQEMRGRHNIRWYAQLGASFFGLAATQGESSARTRLLDSMARGFESWRRRHQQLSHNLREQRYLLQLPAPRKAP
jgi:hypothetical protein